MLIAPQGGPRRAAAAAPRRPQATTGPPAADLPEIPLAAAPNEPASRSSARSEQADPAEGMALAVAALEDDAARQQLTLRGAIPTPVTGPAPLGKPRSPGVTFLIGLVFPFSIVYWHVVARSEIFAHQRWPARTTKQMALRAGLIVLTAGLFAAIYCLYLVPRRIAAMQSACGDPNRVSPPACLMLGLIPVLGWALTVLIMQKALTRHWEWHARRTSDSVTTGLAQ